MHALGKASDHLKSPTALRSHTPSRSFGQLRGRQKTPNHGTEPSQTPSPVDLQMTVAPFDCCLQPETNPNGEVPREPLPNTVPSKR